MTRVSKIFVAREMTIDNQLVTKLSIHPFSSSTGHPLVEIRSRALDTIGFKLRTGILTSGTRLINSLR